MTCKQQTSSWLSRYWESTHLPDKEVLQDEAWSETQADKRHPQKAWHIVGTHDMWFTAVLVSDIG